MTKSRGVGRGGARAGSGRRALDGADVVAVVTAYLDQDAYDLVQELGQGNNTLGIRRMAAELLMYRKGNAPVPTKVLQSTANIPKRRGLAMPTQEDELPVDPRAVYD